MGRALEPVRTALAPLDADLNELLAAWFDIGLLQLEETTWQPSASLPEKLIAYEAAHANAD